MILRRPTGRGHWKVLRFVILGAVLPIVLVVLPLYKRFNEFKRTLHYLVPSDMRLLDQHVSTVWCQGQHLEMNASFSAALIHGEPKRKDDPVPMRLRKQIAIGDDVRRYWGFYLLAGSRLTVRACARWPGGLLLVIKDTPNLRYCAIIGEEDSMQDDSSLESGHKDTHVGVGSAQKEKDDHFSRLMKILSGRFDDRNGTLGETSQEIFRILSALNKNKQTSGELVSAFNLTREEALPAAVENGTRSEYNLEDLRHSNESVPESDLEESIKDKAEEEDLPTGTYVTGHLSQNHTDDQSNSEYKSSFSSSEEALLTCRGVLLNLDLEPTHECTNSNPLWHANASVEWTQNITVDGYYYVVFGSENEIQPNAILFELEVDRVVFELDHATPGCRNATTCDIPLSFWSSDKVVVWKVPAEPEDARKVLAEPEDAWETPYVMESECIPRRALYATCAILAPISILAFAAR
ncbi:unnamed protein product [Darwinula stevensoni]|uniref:E3 ubiquitin-protein ligase APD1-4 N-terminal domain-containing protein n=1 Tax=Darwinula stevensoni TaxID=69355 RepID=A0A7R9A949_9CRUS|nr:unnamed protein product [Darwinula stevensoni]CAG0897061.1 unnamed protein product [Darwinula stevensoni]